MYLRYLHTIAIQTIPKSIIEAPFVALFCFHRLIINNHLNVKKIKLKEPIDKEMTKGS